MILRTLLILVFSILPILSFAATDSAVIWEMQDTATSSSSSMNNGGGFKAGASGTDYSHGPSLPANGAPILTLTDLACLDTALNLTSATGGFTAAMIGNIVHIVSGTQDTPGWYEITAYTDTNTVVIDRTAAVSGQNMTAATGNVGGCLTPGGALDDDFFSQINAGQTLYIKDGSYSLGENVDTYNWDADSTAQIYMLGYKTTRGDDPTLTDRPLLAAAAYEFSLDNYIVVKNISITTTSGDGMRIRGNGVAQNIKIVNSSTTGGREAIKMVLPAGLIIDSEFVSTKGTACYGLGEINWFMSCYIHDSESGIIGNGVVAIANYIETCVSGISQVHGNFLGKDNIIRNCTKAIEGNTNSSRPVYLNNIIADSVDGAVWAVDFDTASWDYNIWDNDTDVTNVTKGDHAITSDPLLTADIIRETDGTTEAGDETDFRSASAPFAGVTTDDVLLIHSGTSVTVGVYTITSVDSTSQLTISAGATTSASSCIFGIIKGSDGTVASGSPALSAGMQIGASNGVTGDYKMNIGVDQDDNTAAGGGGGSAGHVIVF